LIEQTKEHPPIQIDCDVKVWLDDRYKTLSRVTEDDAPIQAMKIQGAFRQTRICCQTALVGTEQEIDSEIPTVFPVEFRKDDTICKK
jgi:hypothetical protein